MKTETEPNPKIAAKRKKFLAYRYGSWHCNFCNALNLNIDTDYELGKTESDLVKRCCECGQCDIEDEDIDY
jgi:hypothetical protein